MCWFAVRRRLVVCLALDVRRPKFGMVTVLVPAEADGVVNPLNALEIRFLARTPDDLDSARGPRERLLQEHFDIDVGNDCCGLHGGGLVPDVRRPRDVLQPLLEPTEPLSSGVSTGTCEKKNHPGSAFLWLAVRDVPRVRPRSQFGERVFEPDGQLDRLTHLDIVLPLLDDIDAFAALLG